MSERLLIQIFTTLTEESGNMLLKNQYVPIAVKRGIKYYMNDFEKEEVTEEDFRLMQDAMKMLSRLTFLDKEKERTSQTTAEHKYKLKIDESKLKTDEIRRRQMEVETKLIEEKSAELLPNITFKIGSKND